MSDVGPDYSDDFPFAISKELARKHLVAGEGREGDYETEIEWVATNIGNVKATPKLAPSNAAWNMLITAGANIAARRQFYATHYKTLNEKKADANDEAIVRKSEIQQFELLEQFEEWRLCPHCKLDTTMSEEEIHEVAMAKEIGRHQRRREAVGRRDSKTGESVDPT